MHHSASVSLMYPASVHGMDKLYNSYPLLTVTHWNITKVPAFRCCCITPYCRFIVRVSTIIRGFFQSGIGKFRGVRIAMRMWRLGVPSLAWQPWCRNIYETSIRSTDVCQSTRYVGSRHCVGYICRQVIHHHQLLCHLFLSKMFFM